MKKIVAIIVMIGIIISSVGFGQVIADEKGNGFADLPPELPLLP